MTGRPSKSEIEEIFKVLTNSKMKEGINTINRIKTERSLSVNDILYEVHRQVMAFPFSDE